MIKVLALVREQIVIQGYDRIQLPDGDFSFEYVEIVLISNKNNNELSQ